MREATREQDFPFLEDMDALKALVPAALERGADPDMVNYLASSGGMQRYVTRMNNRRAGRTLEYWSFEELVMREGRSFTPPKVARPKGMRKGRNKLCFMNAARWALERDDYTYVEGFATSEHGFTVHHAWLVDAEGNVIEATWPKPGLAYMGLPMDDDLLRAATYATRVWGVFGITLLEEPYETQALTEKFRAAARESLY